jgi:hypothetical protein
MTNQSMPMNGTNASLPMNGFEFDWGGLLDIGINTAANIIQQNTATKAAKEQAEAAAKAAAAQQAAYAAQQQLLQQQMAAATQAYELANRSGTGSGSGSAPGIVDRIKNWWAGASTTEKVVAGAAIAVAIYFTYRGVKYVITSNSKKGRK